MTKIFSIHRPVFVPFALLLTLLLLAAVAIHPASAAGGNWTTNGPADATVWSMVIDPTNTNNVYAGTSSGVYKSSNGGNSWTATSITGFSGNPVYLAIDPTTPTTLYASFEFTIYKSVNSGANWSTISGPAPGWHTAVAVDPVTPTTLYVGIIGGSSIYKSTDGGTTWDDIYPGSSYVVSAILVDPNSPSTVYVGGGGSAPILYKTTDGGANWTNGSTGLTGVSVRSIAMDPTDPDILYVGVNGGNGGVFKSTDGGVNWSAINNGLTPTDAYPVAIDPNNANKLYAGTFGGGVFASSDGGASWSAFNSGLTTLNVYSFLIDPTNAEKLYAGTAGGGVFTISPNTSPAAADDTAVINTNTPAAIDVLANDSDPENDSLSISAIGSASNGTAVISGTHIAYTPTTDFTGTDTFTYTVSDGSLTDSATVTVIVREDVGSCTNKSNLIEQLQRTSFYSDANPIYASAGQSFTTPDEVTLIDGITAYFGFIAEEATITLNLYNGPASGEIGTPIATATYTNSGPQINAPANSDLEISFKFNSPIILTPGNVYYYLLSPSFDPVAFSYAFADGNPYSEGSAISGLSSGTVGSWEYDLKFAVFLCAGDEPFALTSHGPAANAVGVALSAPISATFDADVDAATVTTRTVTVRSNLRGLFPHTATVVSNSVTLDPADFLTGERVQVVSTSGVRGAAGQILNPTQWGFTAGPVTNRCVADFTDIEASLTNLSGGNAAWADYDGDGDIDFIVNGISDYNVGTRVTQLYRNEGSGVFTPVNTGLPNIDGLGVAWGDYDNDGDPDILLSGYIPATNGFISDVYRNDGGGTFTPLSAVPANNTSGSSAVAWGDYDNDGDLDFVLTGNRYGERPADVYRNDGNDTFTPIGAGLAGTSQGDAAWGDYDNDGDLDLLLSGYLASGATTQLYRNDGGGTFAAVTSLPAAGTVEWGDYNNDGLLDILLIGLSNNYTGGGVYRNNGDDTFTAITSPLAGLYSGDATFGDYDNDGDLDIAVIGTPGSGFVSDIFRNDGDDTFVATNASIIDVWAGSLGWGDYDNDGDLDLLLTGGSAQNTFHTKIYRNEDCPDEPFALISRGPAAGAVGVSLSQNITATFDAELNASTVTTQTFRAHSDLRGVLNGAFTVDGSSLTFNPAQDFVMGEQVQVMATSDIQSVDGRSLTPTQWSFTPGLVTARCVEGFTDTGASLTNISFGSVGWADYDGDGDLDILLSGGTTGDADATVIHRNDGDGVFTDISAGLLGLKWGSAAWGDYDNDGDPDLIITGTEGPTNTNNSTPVTRLYRNDGGNFVQVNSGIANYWQSGVAWGDYDNDGDLDIVLAGRGNNARIYRNDGSETFTDISAGLPTFLTASVDWGDIDNDSDLDLLITGELGGGGGFVSRVYRNDDGVFTDMNAGLTGVKRGSAKFGDYDNDGYLDILLTGETVVFAVGSTAQVYRNVNGTGFSDIGAGLAGALNSSAAWGDYDNDGDLDILYAGASGVTTRASRIYRNDGGVFTLINAGLIAPNYASVAWGDYDNDGDLDILISGFLPGPGSTTRLYRNDDCVPITDGNGDGIADDQQANVETLISETGNYVTLAAPTGVTLQNVEKVEPPAAPPQNVALPQGLLGFDATGLSAGGSFSMTLTIHTGAVATSYWKYGPTPDNTTPHWYEFLYDGTTGAVINGRNITLYFVDGQRGDSDLQANGTVLDPGAPGGRVLDVFLWLPSVVR